jgi:hypothetical protein
MLEAGWNWQPESFDETTAHSIWRAMHDAAPSAEPVADGPVAERGEYPQELSDAALDSIIAHYWSQSGRALPLYPAHRAFARAVIAADRAQRVPLTEVEIQAAFDSVDMRHRRGKETRNAFARAIERAHKIGAKP